MSWRKNAVGYLMWFLYTVMTGIVLAGLGGVLCARAGAQSYWAILFAILVLTVTGGAAWLLRRLGAVLCTWAEKRPRGIFVLECVLAAGLLILGCLLRMGGMERAGGGDEYYEVARVVTQGRIPQFVHGAVYFYLQLLHGAFRLLGNQYIVGIWLQIVLQLAGSLGLFLVVRKHSGAVAALVTLAFCMCGPYMADSALVLSPDILYFVLMVAAAAVTVSGCRSGLSPVWFLFIGILTAFCCYLDVSGCLLLLTALSMIFCKGKEGDAFGKKAAAVLLCLIGAFLGMLLCIFTDAFLSGKTFQGVVRAWLLLYRPEGFALPALVGGADSWAESLLLLTGMAFGIFGFWYNRKEERISLLTGLILSIVLASCFGILTEEMPGFYAFYLLLALAAGQGLGQCFRGKAIGAEDGGAGAGEGPAGDREAENTDTLVILELEEEEPGMPQAEVKAEEPNGDRGKKPVQYLENPLPLPKKHVKRVMDYPLRSEEKEDDFDHPIADDDDFDI